MVVAVGPCSRTAWVRRASSPPATMHRSGGRVTLTAPWRRRKSPAWILHYQVLVALRSAGWPLSRPIVVLGYAMLGQARPGQAVPDGRPSIGTDVFIGCLHRVGCDMVCSPTLELQFVWLPTY
jgi:hypothetical protein